MAAMGRRHFFCSSSPAAVRDSLEQAGCFVVPSAPNASEPSPGRRLPHRVWRDRQEAQPGSTFARRRTPSPTPSADRVSRRRYCHKPLVTQDASSPAASRRRVPPPPCHMAGAGSKVVLEDGTRSQRHHGIDFGLRAASAGEGRRVQRGGVVHAQRRHSAQKPNLIGGSVEIFGDEAFARCVDSSGACMQRKARAHSQPPSGGVAASLIEAREAPRPWQRAAGRRQFQEAREHLVGGSLRGPRAETSTAHFESCWRPCRSRRPGPVGDHLIGSLPTEYSERRHSLSMSLRPQDHMFGPRLRDAPCWRPRSAPGPRRPSGPAEKAQNRYMKTFFNVVDN